MTADMIKHKLLIGEPLSESEIRFMIYDFDAVDESESDERGRWSVGVFSVFEIERRYFGVYWFRGLTEMQEDYFDEQPFEVKKETYIETREVTKWLPIED